MGSIMSFGQKASLKLKDDADRSFKNKDYQKAVTLYRKYLGSGGDKNIYKNLGISLYYNNQLQEAESFLAEYYKIKPNDGEVVYY
ncbi:MAG: tetratricopeptide repeat protein, partial [Saprospiraceae bacterium]|nr:tetratricopeptide repeat protein [Saprospiraceae bacterium]